MRKNHLNALIIGTFCMLNFGFEAHAQKEDNIWLLGGGYGSTDTLYKSCSLDFSSSDPLINVIYDDLSYQLTNTSVCDSNGQLLLYANGFNVFDHNHNIILNGDGFYGQSSQAIYGLAIVQSFVLIPLPESNKYVYIYGKIDIIDDPIIQGHAYINTKYAIIEKNADSGEYFVSEKDIIFSNDTIQPYNMTLVKHGNGRDWWLLTLGSRGNEYHQSLLTPEGIVVVGKESLSFTTLGLGQSCFSPDGKWFGRFNWHGILPDSSFATIDLYAFDRCTGTLSNHQSLTYDFSGLGGKPGGVAFSPSSRYLYVSCWDTMYQYDLHAVDVWGSQEVIGVYDGFLGDFGLPTRFFTMQLAPNNKIYCSVPNFNLRYLHVINAPDSSGTACDFQQHGFELPVLNNYLVPNLPYYRLWEWEDSPCDTIQTVSAYQPSAQENRAVRLYPNPTNTGAFNITGLPEQQEGYHVRINDVSGRLVYEIKGVVATNGDLQVAWQSATPGMYVVDVFSENFYRQLKMVVQQ